MNGVSYQDFIKWVLYFLAGVGAVTVILGLFADAFSVVGTPLRAFAGSIVIITIWLAWELFIRKIGPRWIGGTRLKKLRIRPRLFILGLILPLWIPSVFNLFKIPEEVSSLPHILYEYDSNYHLKYLRLKSSPTGELASKINLLNNSDYILDLNLKVYILHGSGEFKDYLRPYDIDSSKYLTIGSIPLLRLEKQQKRSLDIVDILLKVFKNHEDLEKFILPELRKPQKLAKINKYDTQSIPKYLFIDDQTMLRYEFFAIPFGKDTITVPNFGEIKPEYRFNGAMLKIIIQYSVNHIQFKHLLVGGLYYQYAIIAQIKNEYREVPAPMAVSGFFKADYSLWKKKESKPFSYILLPQDVLDLNHAEGFQTHLAGPPPPGENRWLFVGPNALRLKEGRYIPLPTYLEVKNNTVPQPRFDPLH
jgi:hypothetical protein